MKRAARLTSLPCYEAPRLIFIDVSVADRRTVAAAKQSARTGYSGARFRNTAVLLPGEKGWQCISREENKADGLRRYRFGASRSFEPSTCVTEHEPVQTRG